jgi:hypothetical protein
MRRRYRARRAGVISVEGCSRRVRSGFGDAKHRVRKGGPCELLTECGRIARRIREPLPCVRLEEQNTCCAKPPGLRCRYASSVLSGRNALRLVGRTAGSVE